MNIQSGKYKCRIVVFILSCALLFGCSGSKKYTIAANGKSPYVIVLSEQASPSEEHAAEELRNFIRTATDADLPLIGEDDSRAQEPCRIFVGFGKLADDIVSKGRPLNRETLGDEGFTIRTVRSSGSHPDVVIAGGRLRGTMYGVYTYLHHVGLRWYTPTVTRCPEGKRLRASFLNDEVVPPLMYRVPYIYEAFDADWSARNRVHSGGDPNDEARGRKMEILGGHTFDKLIPPSLYREHPEYFPLIGGKRVTGYVQRCLTNPEVVKVAAVNMIKWMDENPHNTIFSLGQNDVEKFCECPECSRIMEEQGAPAGLFVHFANQVAEIVEQKHPENFISIFAYTFSEKPPKSIKPRDNVIIRMAPIRLCVGHPFTECTSESARKFNEHLDGWSRLTDSIFVWHYVTDFPNYFMPFPNFNEFTKDVLNYYKRGVKGIFFQGPYNTAGTADAELRAWVIARLFFNPYLDPDELIDEWMHGIYGAAFKPMRAAFDLVQERTASPENHLYIYDPPTREMWPVHVVASLDSLHAAAEKLARSDSTSLHYVRKNRLTVEYLKLILNTGLLKVVDGVYQPAGNTVTVEDYDRFIENTRKFGVEQLREEGMDGSFYTQLRQRLEKHPVVSVENEDILIDTVPNLGGRIVRIIDKQTGKNLIHPGDTYYNYYPVFGGYDEITAFGWHCSGYGNSYDAELKGRRLTLTARNPKELVFSRTISLPQKGRKISFRSSIKNDSGKPQTYRLVCRMDLAADPAATKLLARTKNGSFSVPEPSEERDFFWPYKLMEYRYDGPNKPDGAWRLANESEGWTVEHRFDDEAVETCIWHNCVGKDMVRLEIHSADKEVPPGGRIRIEHEWEIWMEQDKAR